jgi:hypothetical protein
MSAPVLNRSVCFCSQVLLVVTGDHTTPVLYGDHSNEPVPVVICPLSRLRHIGRAGSGFVDSASDSDGVSSAGAAAVATSGQAADVPAAAVRRSASAGSAGSATERIERKQQVAAASGDSGAALSACSHAADAPDEGCVRCLLRLDRVSRFDETAAASGVLGRFPGLELMPLLKRLRAALGGVEEDMRSREDGSALRSAAPPVAKL